MLFNQLFAEINKNFDNIHFLLMNPDINDNLIEIDIHMIMYRIIPLK